MKHLTHLTDCNHAHYSLQLNLYKRILEVENYYPDAPEIRMGILHVTPCNTVPYKISNMTKEIDGIINTI